MGPQVWIRARLPTTGQGPVVGVRAEALRIQEEERVARVEAKLEAKRQAKACKP